MKLFTPQIVWHGNKDPIYGLDFHRRREDCILATGGADSEVRLWKLVQRDGGKSLHVAVVSCLTRHTKAVNTVRFSPDGSMLASAGDDAVILIWKQMEEKDSWTVLKMLRGHREDVYDVCWSSDSRFLISGSIDNTAIAWDIQKGQQLSMLSESKQYVQGVSWDPLGKVVASFGSDRILRIYSTSEHKFKCVHSITKLSMTDEGATPRQFRIFLDETLSSFFRRLTFSPDGSLLIIPAGRFETGESSINCTYVFSRNNFSKPILYLPGTEKPTVAVRFCPLLFELLPGSDDEEQDPPLLSLPYRMVYAVAAVNTVLLYDTQHTAPFAYISNIHYSGITDLSWSKNGDLLGVASSDGYCTFVCFEPGELGAPLSRGAVPPHLSELLFLPPPVLERDSPCSVSPENKAIICSKSKSKSKISNREEPVGSSNAGCEKMSSSCGATTTTADVQQSEQKSEDLARSCSSQTQNGNGSGDGNGNGSGANVSATATAAIKPRRIRPTLISSSAVCKSPSSTSPPPSLPDTLLPPSHAHTHSQPPPSPSSSSSPPSSPSSKQQQEPSAKPRRVNFVTLSNTPPQQEKPVTTYTSTAARRVNFVTLSNNIPHQHLQGSSDSSDQEEPMPAAKSDDLLPEERTDAPMDCA